jgi:hypothetical protein
MPSSLLSVHDRRLLCVLAAGLAGVLSVAAWLTPDPSGHGTHRQLGLPPCSSITLLGLRCPACGMTTSWALMIEGRVAEAIEANVGGSLLFVVAFVSLPWLAWILWSGSSQSRDQWSIFALSGSLCSILIAFCMWAWALLGSKL